MPLYEYICHRCFKAFEVLVPLDKFNDKIHCPQCSKLLKRMMSPVYFKVK